MRKAHSTSELFSDSKKIDQEMKYLHKQIALAEKSIALLVKNFTNISVEALRLQRRQTELSSTLSFIAVEESPSLKKSLAEISHHVKNVSDSTANYTNVIQEHVIRLMSDSVDECNKTRQNVGNCSSAQKKISTTLNNSLHKGSKPSKKKCKQLENDLEYQREALEVTKQIHQLETCVEEFERKKVEDVKEWLKVFIHSSLAHHVKAVEEFTKAYQCLAYIDVNDHITHLKQKLYPAESNDRLNIVRWNSFNSLIGKNP